jgi:hypothetical protein
MDDKRTPNTVSERKPIGMRIRGKPRKRWTEGNEEDLQIVGIRRWRKQCKERAELNRNHPQWVVMSVEEECV